MDTTSYSSVTTEEHSRTETTNKMRISKGRAFVATTALLIAVIVALAIGLGYVLYSNKNSDDKQCNLPDTNPTPEPSPLHVAPSVSIEGNFRFAAVAADNEECSRIGNHIMAVDGGSAVDAAIAAILCVGIHNMHSCGIGGGHFLTVYNRTTGRVHAIVAREQAPSGASEDMFTADKNVSSQSGGQSIAIPGEVQGLWEAYKLGGRLPWKHLFQPAIKLCRDGLTVTDALVSGMTGKEQFYKDFPKFKEFITNPKTGQIYKAGETIYLPKLARTLAIIADEGPEAFYNGSLAKNITADIQEAGGIITEGDLANYTALVRDPLKFDLRDNFTLYSPPAPSSGAVYQFIMNVLDGYRFNSESVSSVDKAIVTWHRITEAFKHAYSLRTHLGDNNVGSDNFKQYVDDLIRNMTDRTYGDLRRQMILDDVTFGYEYYRPSFKNEWDDGTAHLSVLGPTGDAVSITSTINLHFGSKVIGSRTGIIFNDEMDDFSTPNTVNYFGVPASPANFISPWKRPLSSMCPSIVVKPDGSVALVVGASGGTKITTSTALVTMESLWFGWGIKKSVDYPRIHHQLFPQEIQIERTFPKVLVDGLREIGHNISLQASAGCVVQGIKNLSERITANSDFRKGGAPDGY